MDIRLCAGMSCSRLAGKLFFGGADGTSALNCQGRSEPFTKFQTETSPKGMEARFKASYNSGKKVKGLLLAKVMISKWMAI